MSKVTVGIDIGTNSIKALALDAEGEVVTKAKQYSTLICREPQTLEHDAMESWWEGTRDIWAEIKENLRENNFRERDIAGVCVAAMVPSLTAVDAESRPQAPGILYGDQRGGKNLGNPIRNQEFLNFLKWTARYYPDAKGYWPAQTVANAVLGNAPVLDTFTALTTMPLFSGSSWDEELCQEINISPEQLPVLADSTDIVAEMGATCLLGGTTDAIAELVALEPQKPGDVVAIFGSSLLCWTIADSTSDAAAEGLWSFPHSQDGLSMVGGPSNAGGLFIDKVRGFFGFQNYEDEKHVNRKALATAGRTQIPVWLPYINGERTPLHDPSLNANLYGLDLSHTKADVLRAAHEASAFVIRRHIELTGQTVNRIIAAGGGSKSLSWMEAVADATNLPVDIVKIPEGSALGAAWMANEAINDTPNMGYASGLNSIARTIEPDPDWVGPVEERYNRFLSLH